MKDVDQTTAVLWATSGQTPLHSLRPLFLHHHVQCLQVPLDALRESWGCYCCPIAGAYVPLRPTSIALSTTLQEGKPNSQCVDWEGMDVEGKTILPRVSLGAQAAWILLSDSHLQVGPRG